MRFLFHFYDLHQRAGIQRAITELSNALVNEGHEVIVAVNTPRAKVAYSLDERVLIEEMVDPEPHKYGPRYWPMRAVWGFRRGRALRVIVRRYSPSIVVDHGTALGLTYPFTSLGGAPFVLCRHFPVQAFPYGRILYRLLAAISGAKTVVVLTESIAKELRERSYRNVVVIPNMIPAEAKPAPYDEAIPRTGLLLGRGANPQKGFDLFLKALAMHKMRDWHFQLVGAGVDSDPLLLELVKGLALGDQVELLPATADPYQMIRRASCLIMPSRYEGFPITALEALNIGRPVLASDVDGLRDVVVAGVNGLLFPPDDVTSISACLISIENESQRLACFAKKAPNSVCQFQQGAVVEKWCRLVDRLTYEAGPKA